jgi:MFS family permease
VTEPRIGVLAPLRHRDFRHLAAGSLVSLLGDGVFRVTIAVQVLAVRNDPRALSLVAACWAIAQFVALPIGGWAADRFERRRIMLIADVVRGSALTVLGALSVTGNLEIWHLSVLGAVVGIGNGFFNPAAVSLVPDLLPADDLERANAFLGVARPIMLWIAGPMLGAAVIAAGGPGSALLLDAASFGVSALLLLRISRRPVTDLEEGMRGWRATFRGLRSAGRYVRARRWAWTWIAAMGIGTMVHSGAFEVLLPTLLVNDFGMDDGAVARTLAGVFAAGGAGSVLASALLGQRGIPRRFMSVLFACEVVALLAVAGYGLVQEVWQPAVLGLVVFTLFAVTDVIGTTLIQRLVPRHLLGRVASLDWMTGVGLGPVGFLIAGPIGFAVGSRAAILGMGLAGAVLVAGLALVPRARQPELAGPLRTLPPDLDGPGSRRPGAQPWPVHGGAPQEDGDAGERADEGLSGAYAAEDRGPG